MTGPRPRPIPPEVPTTPARLIVNDVASTPAGACAASTLRIRAVVVEAEGDAAAELAGRLLGDFFRR